MNVTFYSFAKRENSTAQPPSGTPGYTYDCKLKDETSIITPHIIISKPSSRTWAEMIGFNYCYIGDFFRYYFIRDSISLNANQIEYVLEVDALGSFKTQIGNTSEYVLRAASSYDGDITDSLYPTKGIVTHAVNTSTNVVFDRNDIGYIVGCINNETTNKFGAVQYYLMSSTELGKMMQYLLGVNLDASTDLENLIVNLSVEIQNGIAKALSNPTQYVVDSYAIPYASKLSTDSSTSVKTGYWITPASGAPLLDNVSFHIDDGTIILAQHPQASSRGNYLNGAPFTKHWLCLGPFGIYPLDSNKFINVHEVEYYVSGDQFGNVRCHLSCQGARFDTLYANVKCPFPLAQVSVDAMGAMQSAITAAAGVQGYSDGSVTQEGMANGILSFANSCLPQVQRSGAQGTMTGIFGNFIAVSEFLDVVDDDLTQRGRPLCQRKTINTLTGYILVSDPDIAITGTAEECKRIKDYMAGGFFYE